MVHQLYKIDYLHINFMKNNCYFDIISACKIEFTLAKSCKNPCCYILCNDKNVHISYIQIQAITMNKDI